MRINIRLLGRSKFMRSLINTTRQEPRHDIADQVQPIFELFENFEVLGD